MKKYEIVFDDDFEDDESKIGVWGISLVGTPAIGVTALQFSEEEEENYEWTQQRFDALMSIGRSPLKYDKNYVLLKSEKVDVDSLEDDLELNLASEDNDIFKVRYSYEGGLRSNSRTFCKLMVGENREFDIDEIESLDSLNSGFAPRGKNSYSVLRFKGGKWCKNFWSRKFYFNSGNKKGMTQFEALQELNKRDIKVTKGMIRKPNKEEGQIADASNNYWAMTYSDEAKKERILTQPILIPNQEIYRRNIKGNEGKIFLSSDTIKKLSQNFLKKGFQFNSTIEHTDKLIENFTVVESWIVDNPIQDKSAHLGFNVPQGSWMVSCKVGENEWNQYIETGEVKGLSVDGIFNNANFVEVVEEPQLEEIKFKKETNQMLKKDFLKSFRAKIELKLADEKKTVIDSELNLHVDGDFEVGKILLDETGGHVTDFRFTYEGVEYKTNSEGVIDLYKEDEVEVKEEVIELSEDAGDVVEELAEIVAEVVAEGAITDSELVARLEAKILELEAKIVELEKEVDAKKEEVEVKEEEVIALKKEVPTKIGFKSETVNTNVKETFEQKIKRLSGK